MNRTYVAVSELIFAGAIWGFGFIATIWALESYSAVAMTLIRFILATLIGLLITLTVPSWRKSLNKQHGLAALWPGLLLGCLMIFQTWGLVYTTATNSGFITTLYVVLVPIYQVAFLRKKLHPLHTVIVLLGLLGTALIMRLEFTEFNTGDLLTFICSNFAALHIIQIDRVQKKCNRHLYLTCSSLFGLAL